MERKSLMTLLDHSPSEIRKLLDSAKKFKAMKKAGILHRLPEGKNIALVFEKDSTRTRCGFELAAWDLGMNVSYLGPSGNQIGSKESMKDTARVLGRMYDAIVYRGHGQDVLEVLRDNSGVPVINALTDDFHPTQGLTDLLTIEEHVGRLEGVKVVFMGDARNNIANSLMIACAKMGLRYTACAPRSNMPDPRLVAECEKVAAETGAVLSFSEDPDEAVAGADIIYTDVWVSMGEPMESWKERIEALSPYAVTPELMEKAGPQCLFMHCLPAFHNLDSKVGREICSAFGRDWLEVSDEVFESSRSIVFDEAENRVPVTKAVLHYLLRQ